MYDNQLLSISYNKYMDIPQMQYYIQLYQDKNISKAAANLYISQQYLSRVIKNMEEEFHVKLFERSVKGVIATEAGHLMYEKCNNVLKEYYDMLESFKKSHTIEEPTLSIGISHFYYSDIMKRTIKEFQTLHPDVSLEIIQLTHSECRKRLTDNSIDFAITRKPSDTDSFECIPAYVSGFLLFLNKGNPLAQKQSVRLPDLKKEKYIMLSRYSNITHNIVEQCNKCGFSPPVILYTSQIELILELIKQNKGISILPEFVLSMTNMIPNIAAIEIVDFKFQLNTCFLLNKEKKVNKIMKSFIHSYKKQLLNQEEVFD